jgi:signal transduction histidine kinase
MRNGTSMTPMNEQALAVLNLLDHAVWITDPESGVILWANGSAVALWNAESLHELQTRPLNQSPTIRATLTQLRDRVAGGQRVHQDRTIFPKGQPKRIEMTIGRFDLDHGQVGLLVEARPVHQADPEMVRAAEAIRYAPIVVVTLSMDGMMIQANTLARQTFGNTFTLQSIFLQRQDVADVLSNADKGETFSRDVQVFTNQGKRWFSVEARKILDPLTAVPGILVSAHDMTARIEAEQAKEDLVSIVSHELRTPMTGIKGAIELLAGGMANDDPALFSELLQMAAENTRRLSALVDDLLDVRKITSGHLSVDFKPCDMKHLLVATVALNQAAAQTRQIKIECHANCSLPIYADEGRIHQVLLNLISNALKHTPPGGSVVVTGEIVDPHVRVTVVDDGPGVPEEFRERIFQRFAQADSSSTRTNSGTGLGLYIAKTLVEVHGGRLGFENAPTGGAEFFFELPLLGTVDKDKPALSSRFRR